MVFLLKFDKLNTSDPGNHFWKMKISNEIFSLLGRLHREEMVWHEKPKMEIIIGKLSSNSTCMSASVENKTMKCFKNDFYGGFVKCSLPMKLREATQFTPFNFYPFHSQMLTVVYVYNNFLKWNILKSLSVT